jgi:hypothetical protein
MGFQQIAAGLVAVTGGLFVLVQAGLLAQLWRRRRESTAGGVPLGVEAVWSLVPALLLACLLLAAGGALW